MLAVPDDLVPHLGERDGLEAPSRESVCSWLLAWDERSLIDAMRIPLSSSPASYRDPYDQPLERHLGRRPSNAGHSDTSLISERAIIAP